jgi:hypothetical protein
VKNLYSCLQEVKIVKKLFGSFISWSVLALVFSVSPFAVFISLHLFLEHRIMTTVHTHASQPTGHAGEWLEHEIRGILTKIHRNERLSRTDLATGALAFNMVRRYSTLLSSERLGMIQRLLAEINASLAARPELLPFDS